MVFRVDVPDFLSDTSPVYFVSEHPPIHPRARFGLFLPMGRRVFTAEEPSLPLWHGLWKVTKFRMAMSLRLEVREQGGREWFTIQRPAGLFRYCFQVLRPDGGRLFSLSPSSQLVLSVRRLWVLSPVGETVAALQVRGNRVAWGERRATVTGGDGRPWGELTVSSSFAGQRVRGWVRVNFSAAWPVLLACALVQGLFLQQR